MLLKPLLRHKYRPRVKLHKRVAGCAVDAVYVTVALQWWAKQHSGVATHKSDQSCKAAVSDSCTGHLQLTKVVPHSV